MYMMQLLAHYLKKYWLDIIVQFLLMDKLEPEKPLPWKVVVMIQQCTGKV